MRQRSAGELRSNGGLNDQFHEKQDCANGDADGCEEQAHADEHGEKETNGSPQTDPVSDMGK